MGKNNKNEKGGKSLIAGLVSISVILSFFIPLVIGYGETKAKVDANTESIKNIDERLAILEKSSASMETMLTLIREDLIEIKADVKEVKRVANDNGITHGNE